MTRIRAPRQTGDPCADVRLLKMPSLLKLAFAAFVVATISLTLAELSPPQAQAAFPGARGRVAFYRAVDGHDEIFTMALGSEGQGIDVRRLTYSAPGEWANDPVWSPNGWSPSGQRLVFTITNNDIGIINSDGTGFRRLTSGPEQDVYPTWTPDGETIVFSSNRGGGDFDFYTVDPDDETESTVQLVADLPGNELQPSFSPDGKRLAFSTGGAIVVMDFPVPGVITTVYSGNTGVFEPDWSPSGTHIVFETFDGSTGLFYIMEPDGGNRRLIRAGLNPSFSPDGHRIIYRDQFDLLTTINPDGTAAQGSQQLGLLPNWQPLVTDTTPPILTAMSAPAPNPNGWNKTDVVLSWICTDEGSGVDLAGSFLEDDLLAASGRATATCQDFAGNATTAMRDVLIDKVVPTLTATATPPANENGWSNSDVVVGWTCTDGMSGVDSSLGAVEDDLLIASGTATASCTDRAGNEANASHSVLIDKDLPVVAFVSPTDLSTQVVGLVLDFGASDSLSGIHSVQATLSDGFESVPVTPGFAVTVPGVYTLTVIASDRAGNIATASIMFVVYDPEGGFVTGSGRVESPAGSYLVEPEAEGLAQFGFVSRYQNGASVPSGNTRFRFQAGGLQFNSDAYDWMVISGRRVQLRGSGEIDGLAGEFEFRLTAIDGDLPAGDGDDRFRIQIWETATGELVFDNKRGSPDSADPTAIESGQVLIQKP